MLCSLLAVASALVSLFKFMSDSRNVTYFYVPSGRWPDDPEAYRKMKAALSLQLAGALEASLGLASQASEDCLDVMAEGFAFRLLMYSEREAAMLQKAAALQQQAAAAAALQAPAAAGAKGQQQQQPPAPPPRPSAHAHEILNTLLVRSWYYGRVPRHTHNP